MVAQGFWMGGQAGDKTSLGEGKCLGVLGRQKLNSWGGGIRRVRGTNAPHTLSPLAPQVNACSLYLSIIKMIKLSIICNLDIPWDMGRGVGGRGGGGGGTLLVL